MTVASSAFGVDFAGRGRAQGSLVVEALPAEREDGVGIESVEGAQPDHRVVALASDRPVVGTAGERPLQPRGVQLDRDLGGLAGALEAALLRAARTPIPAATSSSKKTGNSPAVSISIPCHSRTCGTVARVLDSSR